MLDYIYVDMVERAYDVLCDLLQDLSELQSYIQRFIRDEKRDLITMSGIYLWLES